MNELDEPNAAERGRGETALAIQHHPAETLGDNFESALRGWGWRIERIEAFGTDGAPPSFEPPDAARFGMIISLGGPMSANDACPALAREMEFLADAARSGVRVLGVCLGAQLLSRALGGEVAPTGGYQFGLRKLWITEAGAADPAFSKIDVPLAPTMHGERFTTPPDATRLAEGFVLRRDGAFSRIDMAFRYRNAYGLQFEPQLTAAQLAKWNVEFAADYAQMGAPFDPREEARRHMREFSKMASVHEAQMAAFLREIAGVGGLQG